MQIATCHKNTDFDALASLVAATLLYPGTVAVVPKSINPNVKAFLSIHKDVFSLKEPQDIQGKPVERLVVVDTNQWRRLDRMGHLKENGTEVWLWDHHNIRGDIHPHWQCQETIGANITLMLRALSRADKEISPIQATLFLLGLYEDTGNLTFPSTTAEDAHAAAYLLERRADLTVAGTFLRPAYGERQKQILFQMLQNATRTRVNGYSVSFGKIRISGHVENLSLVVHMYREIFNVDAAFGIFTTKEKDRCIVIGRTNVDGLNIGSIMRVLGGGGHPAAGSALLKAVNADAVEEMIVELIQGNQQSSIRISDLMSFPVFSVTPDTPMYQVAELLREKGCTGFPVIENERLMGIISRRDFRKVKKASQMDAPVKAFMNTDVKTITPDRSPMQAARFMVKHDIGRLPVIENGKVIGIITRSDAMTYFYDLLPDEPISDRTITRI